MLRSLGGSMISHDLFGTSMDNSTCVSGVSLLVIDRSPVCASINEINSDFWDELVMDRNGYQFSVWETLDRLMVEKKRLEGYIYLKELERYLPSDIAKLVVKFALVC